MFKAIMAVLIITIVMIIALSAVESAMNGQTTTAGSVSTIEDEGKIEVTLDGELAHPGTYLIELGSDLGDLLDAAGGVTGNADARAYDTSFLLEDGLSFYIAPLRDQNDVCESELLEKACINTSNKERLLEATPLSSAQCDSLIAYREETPFGRIEEIQNVTGIGPATWEKAKDHITLSE